jgi:hypothetical protein
MGLSQYSYHGTGARHFIMMATHNFIINERLSFSLSIDKSRSPDKGQWLWEPNNDKDYLYGQIGVHYQYKHFDFALALQILSIKW